MTERERSDRAADGMPVGPAGPLSAALFPGIPFLAAFLPPYSAARPVPR